MNIIRAIIADDEPSFRELYSTTLAELGIEEIFAVASAQEALTEISRSHPSIVISDVKMPGMDGIELLKKVREIYPSIPFVLITAYPNIKDAVNSLKLGAVDYLQKPVDLDELKAAVRDILNISNYPCINEIPRELTSGIIAESQVMKSLLNDAYRIAKSDVTILLTGESGCGKEVIASFIHRNSSRFQKPLITMNCASIPANIIASELFGHERGAFTGAVSNRQGKFREADGGTLFLDEIGDMPLELQSSLLRAIENGKICPVGGDREIEVDFRIIAATNKNLEDEIKENRFRLDLYYRLNVITLEIPPLRERKEDILPLARYFLKSENDEQKRLSASTIKAMQNYDWPGNVRELSNAMKRAKVLSRTEIIMPDHLPSNIRNSISNASQLINNEIVVTLEQSELASIRTALKNTNGNQTKAAELLGISRRTLINKLKKI
ncbi:MAG: sigma-54 dependent transcriptional regulator [Lentisphaerota bacterium]